MRPYIVTIAKDTILHDGGDPSDDGLDFKAYFSSYKKTLETLNNQPLKTGSIRNKELVQKRERYSEVKIRFKFTLSKIYYIETKFLNTERPIDLYNFIAHFCSDFTICKQFGNLGTVRPFKQFDQENPKDLFELDMYPSTMLIVNTDSKTLEKDLKAQVKETETKREAPKDEPKKTLKLPKWLKKPMK